MSITIHDELRTLIRIHIDGIPAHTLQALLMSSRHGPWSVQQIKDAMSQARADGFARIAIDGRWHQTSFAVAQDRYQEAKAIRLSLGDRACILLANAWAWCRDRLDRILPGLVLLVATSFLAIGLCAVECPDWAIRGICAVESGCDWRSTGDVRGKWIRGDAGEVSCFQLTPAVLRDLHAYSRRFRVHADPVLAESLTRAWLLHLYGVTGSWMEATAAYHSGLGNRRQRYAISYAERVSAAGQAEADGASAADALR